MIVLVLLGRPAFGQVRVPTKSTETIQSILIMQLGARPSDPAAGSGGFFEWKKWPLNFDMLSFGNKILCDFHRNGQFLFNFTFMCLA